MSDAPNTIRREVLRFLCDRSALPHALSAITAGLRRAGVDTSDELTTEALQYLEDEKWVQRKAPQFGGGFKASTWRATAAGKNQNDDEP